MTANNYATQQDLITLKNDVFQLMSVVKKDNEELKQSQQTTLELVKQIKAQNGNSIPQQMDRGAQFYGVEQNRQGGPIGSTWVINDPAKIQEYRASKAAVNADYYDCKNKILVDYYGRQVSQNTLPIWSCEGDNPEIAIDRENAISRLAYPSNTTMEEELPYNNNFRNLQFYPTTSLNQSIPYGLGL
jgi:hypothetical protein